MENSAKKQLYDLLITKDFDPALKDASGQDIDNPEDAIMFTFDWKTPNKNYGTVVVLVGDNNDLQVFFSDNLGQSMESEDKEKWYSFLEQLKQFSIRNRFDSFNLQNINRLKYTMQGIAAIKEGLFEGYYGNKKYSYSDQPKQVKLVIKHDRTLGEGDKRYRNIESLFVETNDGERFKVPTKNLMHGKMLARHVAEGGNPYDAFGQHINEIINEMNVLRKFIRATRNKEFNDSANKMCESAILHYNDLKKKAKHMISQRGYHHEIGRYDPARITPISRLTDNIRNMFLEQSLDSRIEEALPILAKLPGTKMKEADEFECWANEITEGTWSTPDNPESEEQLKVLLSKPFPVGADATNATEQLYNIFGDDELFDRLGVLADKDPNADCRALVIERLGELGIDIDLPSGDVPAPAEPIADETPPEDEVEENLDVDGVMMTKPSNMSSESVERILKLAQLLK